MSDLVMLVLLLALGIVWARHGEVPGLLMLGTISVFSFIGGYWLWPLVFVIGLYIGLGIRWSNEPEL